MFRLILLLATLFSAGCANSNDVSDYEPFRAFVGRTVALRWPMLLIKHGGEYFTGGPNDIMTHRNVRFGLTEPGVYEDPRIFAELPVGHLLTIDSVQDETCADAYQTVIYGHTSFPPTGKQTDFAYLYAPSKAIPWALHAARP